MIKAALSLSHPVTGSDHRFYLIGKPVCRPEHKGHDDLTSSSPSSGLSPADACPVPEGQGSW
ncbi:hypothetical protein DY000_02059626 [Brassica cretica]|uniref:Uncharacterized protein n=1 Tax=Brassica cretica TaxID=69181 RepID=A0ABQ7B396_BRACR|nr:hypothetical protein DY000_02059626 [Brassica cretica]